VEEAVIPPFALPASRDEDEADGVRVPYEEALEGIEGMCWWCAFESLRPVAFLMPGVERFVLDILADIPLKRVVLRVSLFVSACLLFRYFRVDGVGQRYAFVSGRG
jgi:hypothetical protein